MEPSQLRRAVAAGRATATGLGLRADDVAVVHDSDRVALRLLPCDVLARVAPVAQRADSEWEVQVARRLAEVGAPVAELDPRVEPQVRLRDGFAVSFWTYYEPAEAQISPARYADVLRRHHAALRRTGLDAPHCTDRVAAALGEVDDPQRSPELSEADRELLGGALRGLGAAISAAGVTDRLLHGEPHAGNLLSTHRGPLLVDLATCCRGPVEFDLAHAPEEVAAHYEGTDDALLHRCRALNWAMFSAWRWRRADRMPGREHWRAAGLSNLRAALDRCGPV
jgi:hypothetical protein